LIDLFVKTADPANTRNLIGLLGGIVHTSVGQILTAEMPSEAIAMLAQAEEVLFVEAAKPIALTNDVALPEINAVEVQQGTNLPQALTGKGVVIGIIDTGIDYTHDDFLDAQGASRILAIWDQTKNAGPRPQEIENSYGTECLSSSIAAGSCPLTDLDGHGTHVAGIAAGRDAFYGGVAPDANLIVIRYDSRLDLASGYADTIFSTRICDAAAYVFAKAQAMGLPAVINLSLGTHLGAHDGSSLFEECLEGLIAGTAGRAIVAAAGNEYSSDAAFTGIHAGGVVNGAIASNFVIRTLTSERIYYIDFWADAGSNLDVGLAYRKGAPDGNEPAGWSGTVTSGDTKSGTFLDGLIDYSINTSETASPLNGKQHVGIRIILDQRINDPSIFSFDLIVEGQGAFDAWLFPDKPSRSLQFTSLSGNQGGPWPYLAGDRKKNIAIPATAPNILSVAGYVTRTRWTAGSLAWTFTDQELGGLLDFSSAGPSANPSFTGQKPEIAAPGGMIASALSRNVTPGNQLIMDDGAHFLEAGTSMAAPFVTGTAALLFELSPDFTAADIERFLTQSAYVDEYVGNAPNARWGFGKLNVLGAVAMALEGNPSGNFADNSAAAAPPPENGNGGCSLTSTGSADAFSPITIFLLMAIALLIATRKYKNA
jgi:subtilisin family serine protease